MSHYFPGERNHYYGVTNHLIHIDITAILLGIMCAKIRRINDLHYTSRTFKYILIPTIRLCGIRKIVRG